MSAMDKKDDRPRGKSPDRDRRRSEGRPEGRPEGRHETNRMDPHSVRCRVFIGNLATEKISRQELQDIFGKYGHISGSSLHNNYGFVQYETEKCADEAVAKEDGKLVLGKKLDVHLVSDKRKKGPPDARDSGRGGMRGGRGGRDRPSPPRDRGRMDDYGGDRYGSRFDHPDERFGRPISPRREPFREPFDRPDDYHRERYRDDPYDRREPPPRRAYDDRRDSYDHPPRGDPYYDREGRRDGPRRDDFRREGPLRDDYLRDEPRRDEPRRDEPRRDEAYSRYEYGRNYPDDFGPPSKKSRPEHYTDYTKPIQAPTDCVVIVVSKILLDYGTMVERKFKDTGLVTDLQLLGMRSMAELLDSITRHGVLYAAVITSQHEVHRSVTINILHGTPQEHRNMPLEDALRLVSQNFEQYMQDLRKRAGELDKDKDSEREKVKEREKEKERPVEREKEHEREKRSSFGSSAASKPVSQDSDDMKKLLAKAAGGEQLSTNELSKLIENLSKQKKQSDTPASQSSAGGSSSSQQQPDANSIAKQQADLQAKIFSILNPNTLSKVSLSVVQSASGAAGGASSVPAASTKTSGLLSNPSSPLFPAAKALSGSTSSAYGMGSSTGSTMSGSTGMQRSSSYGSAPPSSRSTQPPSSSYGIPKGTAPMPSWYANSTASGAYNKPAASQQTPPSYGSRAKPSTPASTSYGVPKPSPTSYGIPKASPQSYGIPKSNSSYGIAKSSPQAPSQPSRGGYQGGPPPTGNGSYGLPGRGAPASRGGYQTTGPGRGGSVARGGPPPGVTAVRGAPPQFQTRGPAPRGMPPRGFPARGGAQGPLRYGMPAFRAPPQGVPQGAPISTVQGRGRQPPRY